MRNFLYIFLLFSSSFLVLAGIGLFSERAANMFFINFMIFIILVALSSRKKNPTAARKLVLFHGCFFLAMGVSHLAFSDEVIAASAAFLLGLGAVVYIALKAEFIQCEDDLSPCTAKGLAKNGVSHRKKPPPLSNKIRVLAGAILAPFYLITFLSAISWGAGKEGAAQALMVCVFFLGSVLILVREMMRRKFKFRNAESKRVC